MSAGGTIARAIGIALIIWYTVRYLADPALPGNLVTQPLGWWGWFDQSVTLRSTAALAHANFDASQHHYPMGYALLGLLFYGLARNHAFFFVDLIALLATYGAFVSLARRLGLPACLAALLFAVVTMGDGVLFRQWVVPWNTTPAAAFIWLLLDACAAWVDGQRRPWVIGLLAGAVVACRPSDAAAILPCLATIAWVEHRRLPAALPGFARVALGGALVVLPIIALHLAVYGAAQSLYMQNSARIGFTLHDFVWKAYVLLIDPYPWFADGQGLLQHAHWIALGFAGVIPAVVGDARRRMLAAVLIIHAVFYVSYVDLLPTGLWRFLNIHYFAWAIPGYALLAALLLRDLGQAAWPRRIAGASLLFTLVLLCVQVLPQPVTADEPAKAVDFAGPLPPFTDTFLAGRLALQDGQGVLQDYRDIRGFIYPGGVRVVGLRRDLTGPIAWLPDHAPQGFAGTTPNARWGIAMRLAWPPRWLRRGGRPGIPVPAN